MGKLVRICTNGARKQTLEVPTIHIFGYMLRNLTNNLIGWEFRENRVKPKTSSKQVQTFFVEKLNYGTQWCNKKAYKWLLMRILLNSTRLATSK